MRGNQIAMAADIKDFLFNLDTIDKQIRNGTHKQKETERKLLLLHEWAIQTGKQIGIKFPPH